MSVARKGLQINNPNRGYELSSLNNTLWSTLSKPIPSDLLATEISVRLCRRVSKCCSWLITQEIRFEESAKSAKALRGNGKRDPAPLTRMAKGLRQAANAWKEIKGFHDDRLSITDVRWFDDLEPMAKDAQRRLEELNKIEAQTIESPWPEFVRMVAKCFREEGIAPTYTGRVYDEKGGRPTWFQEFMLALEDEFLNKERARLGLTASNAASNEAHAAAVAKALGGDGKPGKS